MKRIYIIAVLFLLGIWSATAQPFWHPDLGNAPAGSIPLSYDATSYSFETTGGLDSGYDTEAMKNSLNQQLLAANFFGCVSCRLNHIRMNNLPLLFNWT